MGEIKKERKNERKKLMHHASVADDGKRCEWLMHAACIELLLGLNLQYCKYPISVHSSLRLLRDFFYTQIVILLFEY